MDDQANKPHRKAKEKKSKTKDKSGMSWLPLDAHGEFCSG